MSLVDSSRFRIFIDGLPPDLIRVKRLEYRRSIRQVSGTWSVQYTAYPANKARAQGTAKDYPHSLRALGGAQIRIVWGAHSGDSYGDPFAKEKDPFVGPVNSTHKAPVKKPIGSEDKVLFSGFVDHCSRSNTEAGIIYTAHGRGRSGDFCDSQIGETTKFKNAGVDDVLQWLADQYGLHFLHKTDRLEKNLTFAVDPARTGFGVIEEYLRTSGRLLYETIYGNLFLCDAGESIAYDTIYEPIGMITSNSINVAKSFTLDCDFAALAHEYLVYAARKPGIKFHVSKNISNKKKILGPVSFGKYTDPSIRNTRTKVIKATTIMDDAQCQQRAKWEWDIAEGKSVSVSATLQGIVQTNGDPWRINQMVPVVSPEAFGDNKSSLMLTVGMSQVLDESGATTTLELAQPEAFNRLGLSERSKPSILQVRDLWVDVEGGLAQPKKGKRKPSAMSQHSTGTNIHPDESQGETDEEDNARE